jgi:hypothetical protein
MAAPTSCSAGKGWETSASCCLGVLPVDVAFVQLHAFSVVGERLASGAERTPLSQVLPRRWTPLHPASLQDRKRAWVLGQVLQRHRSSSALQGSRVGRPQAAIVQLRASLDRSALAGMSWAQAGFLVIGAREPVLLDVGPLHQVDVTMLLTGVATIGGVLVGLLIAFIISRQ